MIHLRIDVGLTLIGPILTQATSAGAFGIDAAMARDRRGRPYLPYSLVRGKLRQAFEEIQDALGDPGERALFRAAITRWFGPRSEESDSNNQRGTLFFSDFVHPDTRREGQLLSRIKIDQATGAVERRMVMVVDTPFQYGEPAEFRGAVRCVCVDEVQAEQDLQWLGAGLRWLTQLGACRTIGFGRVGSVHVDHVDLTELVPQDEDGPARDKGVLDPPTPENSPATRTVRHSCRLPDAAWSSDPAITHYALRIRPRGLLCIGGPRKRTNVFKSDAVIPGGALLGALATTYCTATGSSMATNEVTPLPGRPWQALARDFAKLRFTHAFPTARGSNERPVVAPLSLAVAEPAYGDIPDRFYDVALCSRPRLIPHGEESRPPVFAPDWKRHVVTKAAEKRFGWPEIHMEVRVRTAIDPGKLRAETERLFGYEMVDPDGLDWLTTLDLSGVAPQDRARVLADIQHLLSAGLAPLGKTKVDADVQFGPPSGFQPTVPSDVNPLPGHRWAITLQTPALLCHPRDPMWSSDTSPRENLHAGYDRIFNAISGGRLQLERFFATQSLSNTYFARGRPRDERGHYYPFVLTDPGSTFVLRGHGDTAGAQQTIATWLAHGIPLARSIAKSIDRGFDPDSGDAWKHCPILNRHGFGEIIVNPPWLMNTVPGSDWPTVLQD